MFKFMSKDRQGTSRSPNLRGSPPVPTRNTSLETSPYSWLPFPRGMPKNNHKSTEIPLQKSSHAIRQGNNGTLTTPHFLNSPSKENIRPQQRNPGDRVGFFEIVSKLGEGGFADVYLAHCIEPQSAATQHASSAQSYETNISQRNVAIKVICEKGSSDIVEKNLEVQANRRIAGQPNVAKMLDAFEIPASPKENPHDDSGGAERALVFEHLCGETIREMLVAHKKIDEAVVLHVAQEACRGLSKLHSKGVGHGDVKPENIILDTTNGEECWKYASVKLIDLGLAFLWNVQRPDSQWTSRRGGTRAYMAPEALQGVLFEPARADVYSLGIVMYEMLCSSRPCFLRTRHFTERQWKEVSDDIKRIIRHCLAEVSSRPNANELQKDLEQIIKKNSTKR